MLSLTSNLLPSARPLLQASEMSKARARASAALQAMVTALGPAGARGRGN